MLLAAQDSYRQATAGLGCFRLLSLNIFGFVQGVSGYDRSKAKSADINVKIMSIAILTQVCYTSNVDSFVKFEKYVLHKQNSIVIMNQSTASDESLRRLLVDVTAR